MLSTTFNSHDVPKLTYFIQISGGRINVTYNSDDVLPRFVDLQFENEVNSPQAPTNGEVGTGYVSQQLTVSPLTSSQSEPNRMPVIDEDLKKKFDIDELINSISVPSLLSDAEVLSSKEKTKVKSKSANGAKTEGNKKQSPKSVPKLPLNRFRTRAIILTSTPF